MIAYYLLLLLTPFWSYPRLPSFGGSFTIIKAVGLVTLLWAVGRSVVQSRGSTMLRRLESILLLALVIIAVLSSISLGIDSLTSFSLQSYISMLTFLYVTLAFVDTTKKVERSCEVMLFSMVLACYSVFSGYLKYGSRPGGIMGDPNYFAMVAASLVPIAYAFYSVSRGPKKWLMLATIVVLIAGTLLSGSRAGVIMLGGVVAMVVLRARRKFQSAIAAASLLGMLVLLLPNTGFDRLLGEEESAAISSEFRRETVHAGLAMIQSAPLTGVGLGMYKAKAAQFNPDLTISYIAHNSYLEIAAELGVPALCVFLAILALAMLRAHRIAELCRTHHDSWGMRLAQSFQMSLVSFAIGSAFLSAEYTKQLWWLIGMGLALQRVTEARARRRLRKNSRGGSDPTAGAETLFAARPA